MGTPLSEMELELVTRSESSRAKFGGHSPSKHQTTLDGFVQTPFQKDNSRKRKFSQEEGQAKHKKQTVEPVVSLGVAYSQTDPVIELEAQELDSMNHYILQSRAIALIDQIETPGYQSNIKAGERVKLIISALVSRVVSSQLLQQASTEILEQIKLQPSERVQPMDVQSRIWQSTPSYAEAASKEIDFPVIVSSNEITDSGALRKQIVTSLDPKAISNEFITIRKGREGQVIVNTKSKDSRTKVSKFFQDNNYIAREPTRVCPEVIVTGVDKEVSNDEVVEAIKKVCISSGVDALENIPLPKLLSRKPCRNPKRVNLKFSTHATVFKALMAEECLNFGWTWCKVEESISPTRCYKCQAYGHVSKHCKSRSTICGICGENHESKNCSSLPRCVACVASGETAINCCHRSGALVCPIFQKQIQMRRQLINYE